MTDRRLQTGYRWATDRLQTGYRLATVRIQTGYSEATDRLQTGYREATDRLQTGYRQATTIGLHLERRDCINEGESYMTNFLSILVHSPVRRHMQ